MGFFDKLKHGLGKTKDSINDKINNVFSVFRKVDEELLEELEEVLITSDIGMDTSVKMIDKLRNKIKKEKIEDEEGVKKALKEIMIETLEVGENDLKLDTKPSIILVVGVNGVGKTTSIGKIATKLTRDGKKVIVAAADTFRAAAVEQLEIWSNKANCEIVKKPEGADPASVVLHDSYTTILQYGLNIVEVEVDKSVNGDDFGNRLGCNAQSVVGLSKGIEYRELWINLAEALVVDNQQSVDVLRHLLDTIESLVDLAVALETEGDGNDTNGKNAQLL